MKRTIKAGIATLGLSLLSGSALAGITTFSPFTIFEDDNIDFAFIDAPDPAFVGVPLYPGGPLSPDGTGFIGLGDVLVAPFKINFTSGLLPGQDQSAVTSVELTGVSAIEVTGVADLDGGGIANDLIFSPYAAGLDSILALGGVGPLPGGLGAAGGPAMLAMYVDDTPDLSISGAATNCLSLADCISKAADGALFQVDGLGDPTDPDPDEYWLSLNGYGTSYDFVRMLAPTTGGAGFDAGLSNYFIGAGHPVLIDNEVPCGTAGIVTGICFGPGDGLVDVQLAGSVLGGGDLGGAGLGLGAIPGLLADGAFGTSDFDILKRTVPAPGSLALLAIGLLGAGVMRRKASA